MKIVLVTSKRK